MTRADGSYQVARASRVDRQRGWGPASCELSPQGSHEGRHPPPPLRPSSHANLGVQLVQLLLSFASTRPLHHRMQCSPSGRWRRWLLSAAESGEPLTSSRVAASPTAPIERPAPPALFG